MTEAVARDFDSLSPDVIVPYLETSWLGGSYHYLMRVDSTNKHALELADNGHPHGTVIVAEEQLAGRGRLARTWSSPRYAGIYASIILKDPLPVLSGAKTTLLLALSLVKVLRDNYNLAAGIKWPNDVLIDGKKVSGILAEIRSSATYVESVVLGIGINANNTREQFPRVLNYPATSIAIELGRRVSRAGLLCAVLKSFERRYDYFRLNDLGPFVRELEEVSVFSGRDVQIDCARSTIAGRVTGFTCDGALRLRMETGTEKVIWFGDIIHARAMD